MGKLDNKHCLLCEKKLPPIGFIFVTLHEMNVGQYGSGYICLKCQKKFGIDKKTYPHEDYGKEN